MDQKKANLDNLNESSDERKSGVSASSLSSLLHPSQDPICPPTNKPQQEQHNDGEVGGKYDHLPLTRLLQQYQHQYLRQQEQQQQQQQQQQQRHQQHNEERGKYDHLDLERLIQQYQQQQQQQQQQHEQQKQQQQQQQKQQQPQQQKRQQQQQKHHQQKQQILKQEQQKQPQICFDKQRLKQMEPREQLQKQNEQHQQQKQQQRQRQRQDSLQHQESQSLAAASSFTLSASSLPSPPLLLQLNNKAGPLVHAASLPREGERTLLSSELTTTASQRVATAATVEAYAPIPFDLLQVSTNPDVQLTLPFVGTTAAAGATRTAGTIPHGIAGTVLRSLLESGTGSQSLQTSTRQYQIQHHHQEPPHLTAWATFSPSRSLAAAGAAAAAAPSSPHSSLASPPFSFRHHSTFSASLERNLVMMERGLHQMQLVLESIPLLHRMEYAMAIRKVPHLVQLESDPTRFLRYTHWDAHAAAHKLVAYWKRRVSIFGPDRAYLPLTLLCATTESSALSKEDVDLIQGGFLAYAAHLPVRAESMVPDSIGNAKTVVILDASRLNRSSSSDDDAFRDVRLLRAFFYHAHCIAENPASQTEGCVCLCIVQSPEYYDHHIMDGLSMLLETFPIRLKEWHTFDCSSMMMAVSPSLSLSLSSTLSSSSSAMLRQGFLCAYFEIFLHILNEYTTYHYSVGDHSSHLSWSSSSTPASLSSSSSTSQSPTTKMFSPDEIRWELETEHGFTAEDIPEILGGYWTYDAFDAWLRERIDYEQSRYCCSTAGDHREVDTLFQDDQSNGKRAGLLIKPMANVAYKTHHHDRRPDRYDLMGRSWKRSKRDQYNPPPGWAGQNESAGKDEEGDDAKPRALDRKQTTDQQQMHMLDSNKQQEEDGQESELDGSLDDLMKQFQRLLFRDLSTPAVLPNKASFQQNSIDGSISALVSGQIPFPPKSGISEQPLQAQQQRAAVNTYLMPPTSAVSPFTNRMTLLNPVALVEKAVNAIPMKDKASLMKALQLAPHLVARESDPMRFLECHEFDAQRAAQGLVDYWKARHEWFGDRAYLPMTMFSLLRSSSNDARVTSGNEGALTAEDICVIQSGAIAIIGTDRHGSPVYLTDPSRRIATATNISRFRALFYIFQVLSEYRTSQTQGVVVIHVVRSNNLDKVSTKSTQMVFKSFPVKFKAIHSFDCMEKKNWFLRGFVQGLLGVLAPFFSLTRVHFYTSQCQQERERNVQVLEDQHGLTRDLLPYVIGGTWKHETFEQWLIQRTQEEKQLFFSNAHMMTDVSVVNPSISMNADPRATTWYRPLGGPGMAIAQEPRVDKNSSASSTSIDMHEISSNLQSLESAMRHLPLHETKDFRDALQNAKSNAWEEECNPDLFLRVENFDMQKAGERMAKYWQVRSQTFGKRTYDLLTQSGEDALERKDLRVLETGFLTPLPTDRNGQSILFVDLSRISGDIGSSECNRCLFYMMSLLAENEKSQTDGAILLHWIHPPNFTLIDIGFLETLVKALPLTLCRIHLVSHDNIPADAVFSSIRCGGEIYIHSNTCKNTLCSELESFGMKKAGLPKIVNGGWGYEKFVQWQELRLRIEWKIPAGLSGRECTDMANYPAMKAYKIVAEGKERQRRLNSIHTRRKQYRYRLEVAMLKENCIDLQEEQKQLLEENRQLEETYALASAILNSVNE